MRYKNVNMLFIHCLSTYHAENMSSKENLFDHYGPSVILILKTHTTCIASALRIIIFGSLSSLRIGFHRPQMCLLIFGETENMYSLCASTSHLYVLNFTWHIG